MRSSVAITALAALAALVALALPACGLSGATDACEVDGDCNLGRVCVAGHCADGRGDGADASTTGDGAPVGPPACACPSNQTCDARGSCVPGGELVLVGGENAELSAAPPPPMETWTWDGLTWKKTAITGPKNLWGTSLARLGDRLFIVSGDHCCSSLTDTWELTSDSWPKAPAQYGPVFYFASGTIGSKIYVFGGGDSRYYGEFYAWDGKGNWNAVTVAQPKWRRSAASAVLGGRLVMVGGIGLDNNGTLSVLLSETWEWDGVNWVERKEAQPSARFGASMAQLGDRLVMFGGATSTEQKAASLVAETWEWDGTHFNKRVVSGPSPPARIHAAMAELNGRIVLFGGLSYSGIGPQYLSDTWEWDGNAWTERKVQGPTGRTGAAMARLR